MESRPWAKGLRANSCVLGDMGQRPGDSGSKLSSSPKRTEAAEGSGSKAPEARPSRRGGSPGLHTCTALSGFPALFSLLVSALTVSDARPASVCLFNSPQTLLSYFITTYRDPVIKSCRDRYPRWDHLHALHHHLPGLGYRPQSPPNWPPALLLGTRLHSPHHTHSQL